MKPSELRILVVEDDLELGQSIKELFETFQFNVSLAHSGNAAWVLLQAEEFHIVLSDVRMRNGNGLELAQKIRARDARHPGVLLISGFSELLLEEFYHEGVDGFFAKPFDANSVRDAVYRCLLDPVARWSNPNPTQHSLVLNRQFESIEAANDEGALIFGRGGFFMAHPFTPPSRGVFANFSLKFDRAKDAEFTGEGITRWFQTAHSAGAPAGLGIEITSMPPADSARYKELFGNTRPFIPSVRKASRTK